MKASLQSLHHQNTDWLRELEFYKEEITILTGRLEEVIGKNTGTETTSNVEHFQNKFVILREQLDILKHDVTTREQGVTNIAESRPEHVEERFSTTKDSTLSRMKDLAASFADTRFEFNQFLAKVM